MQQFSCTRRSIAVSSAVLDTPLVAELAAEFCSLSAAVLASMFAAIGTIAFGCELLTVF